MDELEQVRRMAREAGVADEIASTLKLHRESGFVVAYRPGRSDEGVLEHSFARDIFLPNVPEYAPGVADVVVEIGGHIGDFALMISRRVATVYTIEARKESHAILTVNLALNRIGNVTADRLAIADRDGEVPLFLAPENESWADSTTIDWNASSEPVPARTLEGYLRDRNIAHVDFLKLNCEGGEFPILLASSSATLRKCRIMLVLFHEDFAPGYKEEMLISHLEQAGFSTVVRQREPHRGWIIAVRR